MDVSPEAEGKLRGGVAVVGEGEGEVAVAVAGGTEKEKEREKQQQKPSQFYVEEKDTILHLHEALRRFMAAIFFPASAPVPSPLMSRFKTAVSDVAPLFPPAAQNTAAAVLSWVRAGRPFRALVVAAVGMITLVALTGLLLIVLFFLAATTNFIIICFLISLALLGGTIAFFFACVTAVYIGVLSIATFVISAVTISIIIAVLVATGCIGFFWVAWLVCKKTIHLGKQSLGMTSKSSTFSAYSAGYDHQLHLNGKGSVGD